MRGRGAGGSFSLLSLGGASSTICLQHFPMIRGAPCLDLLLGHAQAAPIWAFAFLEFGIKQNAALLVVQPRHVVVEVAEHLVLLRRLTRPDRRSAQRPTFGSYLGRLPIPCRKHWKHHTRGVIAGNARR